MGTNKRGKKLKLGWEWGQEKRQALRVIPSLSDTNSNIFKTKLWVSQSNHGLSSCHCHEINMNYSQLVLPSTHVKLRKKGNP